MKGIRPGQKEIFALTEQELHTSVSPLVTKFVRNLLGNAQPLGVLFYGSGLRGGIQDDTLLDFYIIVDKQSDWPRTRLSCLANALLPPNVEYHEYRVGKHLLRTKVAILSLAQFRALTRPQTLDTTVWARFSQPVRLVWWRDSKAQDALHACVMRAVLAAAWWAAQLGPDSGTVLDYWNALYRNTYRVELRVEKAGRGQSIVDAYTQRYAQLLLPCWQMLGIPYISQDQIVTPQIQQEQKQHAIHKWALRASCGRPLNILRLLKAAYTFTGGARYAAWKVQRHSGIEVPLSPFAEKHPLLAAPPIVWRLWQQGAFKRK
ncbi:hypothetical protein [Acetobacter pasteurianus]|uniref:hypothetical protein n=1 Tax=Acetobacter TaxID=434 RepID=UPI000676BE0B|nr:hypothetical protein [Acetobacter pasteurianus]AKR49556.1 hypothetical protein DB34_12190 [Acetobacter pasteurianus]